VIVFVGSNPSNAAKDLVPFTPNTVSGRVLRSWIDAAGITDWDQYNVVNSTTPGNRCLSFKEIMTAVPELERSLKNMEKVVALGKTAVRALKLAKIPHLAMPHPSGLNRKLNDAKYVEQCIQQLKEYYES
jgi:uracil-DNA glycosylase